MLLGAKEGLQYLGHTYTKKWLLRLTWSPAFYLAALATGAYSKYKDDLQLVHWKPYKRGH
jgi:hypothetical protein